MNRFAAGPIVVPTDLSDASAGAIQVAQQLTAGGGDVVTVHVGLDQELIAPAHIWGVEEFVQENHEERAADVAAWIRQHGFENVRQELRWGDPGLEICELASELSSPLIVIPSHGRSGLERILLGSVAERVIRHAPCSVLVLRRTEVRERDASETWLPRQRIVVPVDLSESTGMAVETAQTLTNDPSKIDVINVLFSVNDALIAGSMALSEEDITEARRRRLREFLDERGWTDVQAHVLTGHPGLTISDYADQVQADLIVMPSHGFHGLNRLLLGSTTERVLRHTRAPVLVLRRPDAEPH